MFLLTLPTFAAPDWQERFDRTAIEALHDETRGELTALAVGAPAKRAALAICASPPGCTVQTVSRGRGRKPESQLLATAGSERTWVVRSIPGLDDAVVATLYQGSNPRTRALLRPGLPMLTQEQWEAQGERITRLTAERDALQSREAVPVGPSESEEREAAALLKSAATASNEHAVAQARELLDELDARFPDSRANSAATRLRDELAVVGLEAPEPTVERWVQGEGFTLASKEVTLVVFFEAWCPHCKRELPKLQELHEKHQEAGLGVLGLTRQTRDITDRLLREFLESGGVTFAVAQEMGDESERYSVRGIPAAVIVKDGTVVWRGHPARVDDDFIETLLSE